MNGPSQVILEILTVTSSLHHHVTCIAVTSPLQVILEILAFTTPSENLEELRRLFVAMDADGSGSITLDEFREALSKNPEVQITEVERLFKDMCAVSRV